MNNKKVILNLTLPLAVITFIFFTKWWIADVVDGSDGVMYGFPLIYKSPAFYTSMAEQYFIMEFLIDFTFYLIVVFAILIFDKQIHIRNQNKKKNIDNHLCNCRNIIWSGNIDGNSF